MNGNLILSLGYFRDCFKIEDIETGIADQFAVDKPCVVLNSRLEAVDIGRVDESCRDAEPGQVFFIRLMLPPYICVLATMWSPCAQDRRNRTKSCGHAGGRADRGGASLRDAAMRCSRTPTVGFVMRL